ncbi:MAG TPA: ABC transporter ATP-binding protein [Ktedonobacteraceae bacterium]|nr:ABC transporter ATP-binding protein [Ktedonobacteraceae bacterium]
MYGPYMRMSRRDQQRLDEGFKFRQVFEVFTSLPRVLRLVWSTHALFTATLGILSVAQGFMPAITVLITRSLIDSVVYGIVHHTISPIWLPVSLQLAAGLVSNLFSTLSNTVQQFLQELVSNRVQFLVLEKSNTLDLAFFENAEFYDKLRNATDQSTYQPVTMVSQTFGLLQTFVTLISMLLLLLQLAWWLAIIALLVPIPSFIASSRYGWRGYQLMRRQSPERRLMAYFNQVMTTDRYNKEIKLFDLGNFFIQRFKRLANKFYEEKKSILVRRYLTGFLWTSVTVAANSGIYLYVAYEAVVGHITLGGLTLYTQSALQTGQNFQALLNGISGTYETNLYVNTLFEFLEYEPKLVSPEHPRHIDPTADSRGLDIEFRNVSFTYPDKDPLTQVALRNVSFTVRAGESIALVGSNGAGKTTIVKLLTRLYDPDEGEILIGGHNIKEYNLDELREHVGVIFQDYVTWYLSARENIGVGRIAELENQPLVAGAARKSGADKVIERLSEGYDTTLGRWFEKGAQLSGGEWQKVALARAFMRDAGILILDEPTSSLDAQAEYEVFARFRELTTGKTAIFISHRFSTVRLADRILVLEHGQIIESGSHEELLQLDKRYAELFNLQAEAYR